MTARTPRPFEIPVSLVRDYHQINRELVRALDDGRRRIRLTDVEGQRLLAAGLRGDWPAEVEILGNAGPELALGLDAPELSIICRGNAADGAGRGLRSGRLIILGHAGDAVGALMSGGSIVVQRDAGHRVGLRQRGGTIVLLGRSGRLLADRQSGGFCFAAPSTIDGSTSRERSGGSAIPFHPPGPPVESDRSAESEALRDALRGLGGHLDTLEGA
jgi:hypothetical protein